MRSSRRSFIRLTATGTFAAALSKPDRVSAETALAFDFHSSFWTNLHHRLYMQSQAYQSIRRGEKLDPAQSAWSAAAASSWTEYLQLSPSQRAPWEHALQIYATKGLADQDLLGSYMPAIDAALSDIAEDADLTKSDTLHSSTVEAMMTAAPIYRSTLWNADDAANRAWISTVSPLIAAKSARLTSRLRAVYGAPWPVGPYRVDVTRYANWAGSYTNTDPIHIIMSSRDFVNNRTHASVPNTGLTALEMVFHEASHTVVTPGYGTIGTAIENAAAELGKAEPDGLWHAVIFYTVGQAVAREYYGQYTMFADSVDVYTHGRKLYRKALADHWQPFLDGRRRSLNDALRAVVEAVT